MTTKMAESDLLENCLSKHLKASRSTQKSIRFSGTEWGQVLSVLKAYGDVQLADFVRGVFNVLATGGRIISAEEWAEYKSLKESSS